MYYFSLLLTPVAFLWFLEYTKLFFFTEGLFPVPGILTSELFVE